MRTQNRDQEEQNIALQERNGTTTTTPRADRSVEEERAGLENTTVAPERRREPVPGNGSAPPNDGTGIETVEATEEKTPIGSDTDQKKRRAPSWVKPLVLTALVAAIVLVGIWGYHYWQFSQTHVTTDDAYLTSDLVQITPEVSGNIAKILVAENQNVQAGQPLAILDDSTYRADVEQAHAALAVAKATAQGAASTVGLTSQTGSAQIEQAQGGVSQAESAIAGAQADVARARAAVANAQAGVLSARANVSTAQAALQAAISARQRSVEAVRSAQAQVTTAQAGVRSAQADLTAAQANADKAGRDEARYAELYRENAVSAQQVDVATAAATSARSQVDSAQQQIQQAQSTVAQRQADVAAAQDAVHSADATIDQARAQLSAARNAVTASQANVQQMQAQQLSAQQNVGAAEAKRTQALGQLSQAHTAPRQVAVSQANQQTANAHIQEAQAALDQALINLNRTRIYAPVSGTVSKKTAEIGQQVSVGQPLMAIVPTNTIWVVANFQETQMRNVRSGQHADIEVDTFPGRKFSGYVQSIAAGTGATFALLPPENATGNFTKVVQRVPVRIFFTPGQKDLDKLRPGLSAVVTITTK